MPPPSTPTKRSVSDLKWVYAGQLESWTLSVYITVHYYKKNVQEVMNFSSIALQCVKYLLFFHFHSAQCLRFPPIINFLLIHPKEIWYSLWKKYLRFSSTLQYFIIEMLVVVVCMWCFSIVSTTNYIVHVFAFLLFMLSYVKYRNASGKLS